MTPTVACRRCGWEIPPEMPERLCGRCLLVPAPPSEEVADEDQPDTSLPQVPRYRIIRLIGAGGVGKVYEAEQEHPRRRVALKLLKPSAAARDTLRRLRYEAEVLGRLQHPGIAQIFESGTIDGTRHGRPYFAMELVGGPDGAEPLTVTAYAERQRLDVSGRLEVLARVADAVHFAHERGVVHRDLKPANVLVDEQGQPKVVDFGVARFTDADVRATTMHTEVGQIVGTLAYMSPEQAGGAASEIDARADVYALGAIAYELLAARLPVPVEALTVYEAVRAIREEEPRRLGCFDPALRGDVETVVGKALEKDKERRYATAAAFAADVRRCLDHQPVSARPPTAAYYLSKTLRRHRAAAWASCAVVAVVAGLTAYGAVHVARARGAADAAQELARREGLAHHYWRQGRLTDARREFAAALSAATNEDDRARIRMAASQADERLNHCFHGAPFRVGQVIRAVDFDTGGEGVSYHDTDGPNAEPHARADAGVDVINGVLSYLRAGEWVQYTVEVPADGRYDLECRGGNTYGPAGVIRVEFDGVDKTGRVRVPGPVSHYEVFRSAGLRLAAGRQVMRVVLEEEAPQGFVGGLEWFRLVPSAGGDEGPGQSDR